MPPVEIFGPFEPFKHTYVVGELDILYSDRRDAIALQHIDGNAENWRRAFETIGYRKLSNDEETFLVQTVKMLFIINDGNNRFDCLKADSAIHKTASALLAFFVAHPLRHDLMASWSASLNVSGDQRIQQSSAQVRILVLLFHKYTPATQHALVIICL